MSNFSFVQLLENDLEEAEDLELLSEQELLVEWSEDEEDKNRLELEET